MSSGLKRFLALASLWVAIASGIFVASTGSALTPPHRVIIGGPSSASPAGTFPPYNGLVATQLNATNQNNFTSFKQGMSRAHFFARTNFCNPTIAFPGFYQNANTDVAQGSDSTITASIEYPAGSFTQVKFLGSATGTITNNTILTTDTVPICIPNGASFWVRSYVTNATQIIWSLQADTANGDAGNLNSSGVPDQTMGGTITNNNFPYRPLAVLATTNQPTILALGDSIIRGQNDTTTDGTGNIGTVARSITPAYATANIGINSGTALQFAAGGNYLLTKPFFKAITTHVVANFGRNDIFVSSRTAAQLTTNMTAIATAFSGKPFLPTTLIPDTTATQPVTLLTSIGTTATAVVTSTATLTNGQSVQITGATPSAYNVTAAITVTSPTTFTYTFAGGISPATGTILWSDLWASLANQTTVTGETERVTYNTSLRGTLASWWRWGSIDVAAQIESGSTGKFIVNGSANYCTADGIHPSNACYLVIKNSSVVNPTYIASQRFNYLLNRDLSPANDNFPVGLARVG